MLRYIIYNVSKEEYDSCRISQTDPRVVAVCDKPDRQLQFTITFRCDSPYLCLDKPRNCSHTIQTVSPSLTLRLNPLLKTGSPPDLKKWDGEAD